MSIQATSNNTQAMVTQPSVIQPRPTCWEWITTTISSIFESIRAFFACLCCCDRTGTTNTTPTTTVTTTPATTAPLPVVITPVAAPPAPVAPIPVLTSSPAITTPTASPPAPAVTGHVLAATTPAATTPVPVVTTSVAAPTAPVVPPPAPTPAAPEPPYGQHILDAISQSAIPNKAEWVSEFTRLFQALNACLTVDGSPTYAAATNNKFDNTTTRGMIALSPDDDTTSYDFGKITSAIWRLDLPLIKSHMARGHISNRVCIFLPELPTITLPDNFTARVVDDSTYSVTIAPPTPRSSDARDSEALVNAMVQWSLTTSSGTSIRNLDPWPFILTELFTKLNRAFRSENGAPAYTLTRSYHHLTRHPITQGLVDWDLGIAITPNDQSQDNIIAFLRTICEENDRLFRLNEDFDIVSGDGTRFEIHIHRK